MKRTLLAAALLGVLALAGCSESPSTDSPQPDSWVQGQQADTIGDVPPPPADLNAQGRRVMRPGDTGGIHDQLAFTVVDVSTSPACGGDLAEPTKHGQYVSLTLDVQTEPGFVDNIGRMQNLFNENSFHGILDTGLTYAGLPNSGLWCDSDSTEVMTLTDWTPNSHYRATYVFDAPTNLAAIVIPANVGFNGWEIPIP